MVHVRGLWLRSRMARWVLVAKRPAVGPRYCEFTDGRLEVVRQGTERGVVLRTLEEGFL
ncbi:hypothetical protein [Streptomyces sp. NPDC087859]|uniref:hypothetical protein n=1 Tax=Streptomyces sp. NPDC087859 TaxID=3365812 RepID=UPI003807EA39